MLLLWHRKHAINHDPLRFPTWLRRYTTLLHAFDTAAAQVCLGGVALMSCEEAANLVAQFDTAVSLMQHKRYASFVMFLHYAY